MSENTIKNLFKSRNFKLLFWGEAISNLGDQFTFIGLAWLVTRLTSSSSAIGLLLALSGFPRAIVMLISGTFIDRLSSKKIMIASNTCRFLIVAALGILILSGEIKMWMIYLIALLFGIADAFFMPARSSMVPHIVPEHQLGAGNAFVQGLGQLSQFIGPFLVGSFIGYIETQTHTYNGIGFAMLADAMTFIVSLVTLQLISVIPRDGSNERIAGMVRAGFLSVWNNVGLRYLLGAATLINFSLIGPFLVGIPLIAKDQLFGAYSYGYIMSAWGIGALVGYVLSGFVIRPKRNQTTIFLTIAAIMGLSFSLFSSSQSTPQFVILSLISGICAGYIMISLLTIIQKNTPPRLMGRTMSTVMFCAIGLNPVSELIAGTIYNSYGKSTFLYAGLAIIIISIIAILNREVRTYGTVQVHNVPS